MDFNTAVLYDIENLIGGYGFKGGSVANLDLRDILKRVKEVSHVKQIAVQRAYANWSIAGLAGLRGEISELGIDPMQVFGFSAGNAKNAADIQLCVDAIDLANIRSAIDVYVIVSGDGGFASLAKKLHEYGKTVIGIGFDGKANRTLQSVCDVYIKLPAVQVEGRASTAEVRPTAVKALVRASADVKSKPALSPGKRVGDPRNLAILNKFTPLKNPTQEDTRKLIEILLKNYASTPEWRKIGMETGFRTNVFRELLNTLIPNLKLSKFGYPKFTEFLQYFCSREEFKVGRFQGGDTLLVHKDNADPTLTMLPDLEAREIDTPEGYLAVLAAQKFLSQDLRINDLQHAITIVTDLPPIDMLRGEIVEMVAAYLSVEFPSEMSRHAVSALYKNGIFGEPKLGFDENSDKLTLAKQFETSALINKALLAKARIVITQELGNVKDDVINSLFA